jgi:hypothetical protein
MTDTPLEQPGIEALRKERERANALESELKELRSKNQGTEMLAEQLSQVKKQLVDFQSAKEKELSELKSSLELRDKEILESKIERKFKTSAIAYQLNADYQDVLLAAHKSRMKLTEEDKLLVGDKTFEDWILSQREQLPRIFDAPDTSGSGSTQSHRTGYGQKKSVPRDDSAAFIDNIEAIAKGDINTI